MAKTISILCGLFLVISSFAQNGNILSKKKVELSQTPIWTSLSKNDTLLSEYQYLNKLDFYIINYESDKKTVKGIIVEPKELGKYPVIIFNRGGNRDFAPLNIAMMVMYTSKIAEQGFVIIGSNYREQDEFGGNDINDVLYLTETIKELDKADTNTIGMFGWSRGGMMTYLALQKSNKIKTAIVGNGPTDLFGVISERPEMETNVIAECVPNYYKNKEEELKRRSVIFWADELNKNCSLLILCGIRDDRVNPKQAHDLADKLKEINYDFELREFDTDHSFSDKKEELDELLVKWFTSKLKKP
jgi:dipeptidyl aminopeptidase/acylaminoacyl peptidase